MSAADQAALAAALKIETISESLPSAQRTARIQQAVLEAFEEMACAIDRYGSTEALELRASEIANLRTVTGECSKMLRPRAC